jgi:NTP pyrophosphatase (non-canonical NTP hydrolase)
MHNYQNEVNRLLVPNARQMNYLIPGLFGEVGEFAEIYAKAHRKHGYTFHEISQQYHDSLVDELGDILFFVSAIASYLGVSLDHVAESNIRKLKDRKANHTIELEKR